MKTLKKLPDPPRGEVAAMSVTKSLVTVTRPPGALSHPRVSDAAIAFLSIVLLEHPFAA
jgi:hypothetical protein